MTTLDGETFTAMGWDCVFMLLAGTTEDGLRALAKEGKGDELVETFVTLTDNFVLSNTKMNINRWIHHQTILKVVDMIH